MDQKKSGRAKGLEEGRAKGLVEGRAEGRAEGIAEGEKAKAFAIAANMKQIGLTTETIVQVTGLTAKEIDEI